MYFGVLRDSSAVAHQLLDGHPVIQDLFVSLLQHLLMTELQDVYLLPALGAAGWALPQTLEAALLHELPPLPLLPRPGQVLLPLLFAPVAAHLHLAHGVIVRRHASAPLLSDPQGSLPQDPVASRPTGHVARAIGADLDLPLETRFPGAPAPLHLIPAQTEQAELALGILQGRVLLQQLHVTLQQKERAIEWDA